MSKNFLLRLIFVFLVLQARAEVFSSNSLGFLLEKYPIESIPATGYYAKMERSTEKNIKTLYYNGDVIKTWIKENPDTGNYTETILENDKRSIFQFHNGRIASEIEYTKDIKSLERKYLYNSNYDLIGIQEKSGSDTQQNNEYTLSRNGALLDINFTNKNEKQSIGWERGLIYEWRENPDKSSLQVYDKNENMARRETLQNGDLLSSISFEYTDQGYNETLKQSNYNTVKKYTSDDHLVERYDTDGEKIWNRTLYFYNENKKLFRELLFFRNYSIEKRYYYDFTDTLIKEEVRNNRILQKEIFYLSENKRKELLYLNGKVLATIYYTDDIETSREVHTDEN